VKAERQNIGVAPSCIQGTGTNRQSGNHKTGPGGAKKRKDLSWRAKNKLGAESQTSPYTKRRARWHFQKKKTTEPDGGPRPIGKNDGRGGNVSEKEAEDNGLV